jgi:DNA-binding transcriptional ArsR family regulator
MDVDNLRRADILVLLKLAVKGDASVRALESELGLSKSMVALSIRRLREANLLKDDEAGGLRINKLAARDFLQHGARWIAPAKVGDFELGFATAHSFESLARKLSGDPDPVVLPLPHGPIRGRAVSPLHPKAPAAAQKDPRLLRLLAIVDALRIGRARDRDVAMAELRACL